METTLRPGDRIPMSWEEYLETPVRGEYIDGELVVAPAPTKRHQRIARRLANLIEGALPAGYEVIEAWGWKPTADEFVPDVMVFAETAEDKRLTAVPVLVVEVLSTDPARDIIRKAAKYAAAGLERYWIVDLDGPEVIVLARSGDVFVEHERHGPGRAVTVDLGPTEVTFDPADLAT